MLNDPQCWMMPPKFIERQDPRWCKLKGAIGRSRYYSIYIYITIIIQKNYFPNTRKSVKKYFCLNEELKLLSNCMLCNHS